MRELLICPSILAADFTQLGQEIKRVDNADFLHIDVMDGHYVPNLSYGPVVAQAASSVTDLPLDVHLMVTNPEFHVSLFSPLNPGYITVHYEACTHLQRCLSHIRSLGIKAGVALNPHTPESILDYVLDDLDLILVMTVNPGYGGQSFISAMFEKISRVRKMIGDRPIQLQVDGGISLANIKEVTAAGANMIVAGSAIFEAKDANAYIKRLKATVN